jgi:hypothetical protein
MATQDSAKKHQSGSIYAIYRKLRYLKRRGTLFRRIPPEKPAGKPKNSEDTFRGKVYQFYRVVRFLANTGRLFKRDSEKKKVRHFPKRKIIYRKLRYLVNTGKVRRAASTGIKTFFRHKFSFLGKRSWLIIMVNSTALFLLAYFVVYLLTQFAVMIAAISFNIETVLYYFEIDFLIRSSEWVPDAIKVVYTTGPFVSLILALLSIIIYFNLSEETWKSRLFILWLFCHSFIHFFGEFLMGNLLGKGFGYVIMYLFFLDTPKMVMTLIDFVVILFTGLALSKLFLFSGNIYLNKLDKVNRMPFALSQFLLPFLLGTGLILLLKIPGISSLEICVDFSMLLLLMPVIFRARVSQDLFFEEEEKKIKPFWVILVATVIIAVLFRIILGVGIRF